MLHVHFEKVTVVVMEASFVGQGFVVRDATSGKREEMLGAIRWLHMS